MNECLNMMTLLMEHIDVNPEVMEDERYNDIFSVEEVNKHVLKGIPFRNAYKMVAEEIKKGTFKPDKKINHKHEGSIGNLCNDMIEQKLDGIMYQFNFMKSETAMKNLLGEY
jgi:argininosuccinate lyase